ncbi:MAG TPA: hypothetical protein GXZ47_06540 [Treponema sp.]|nr:hypothetical protein [Treponema sp.]
MLKKMYFTAVVFCALCAVLPSGLYADDQALVEEGIRYHTLAEKNPQGNIEKGKEVLFPIIEKNALAKGYYGSLITLEASMYETENNVFKAALYLEKGTALLDEAVVDSPNNIDLRFLRMINSYELSNQSPMNRYKIMKIDIDWLEGQRDILEPGNAGLLDLYTGLYLVKARKLRPAIVAFESCIEVSPGSPEAAEAQIQLDRYGE